MALLCGSFLGNISLIDAFPNLLHAFSQLCFGHTHRTTWSVKFPKCLIYQTPIHAPLVAPLHHSAPRTSLCSPHPPFRPRRISRYPVYGISRVDQDVWRPGDLCSALPLRSLYNQQSPLTMSEMPLIRLERIWLTRREIRWGTTLLFCALSFAFQFPSLSTLLWQQGISNDDSVHCCREVPEIAWRRCRRSRYRGITSSWLDFGYRKNCLRAHHWLHRKPLECDCL